MKTDVKKLSGVPETMLYTFYMRYLESKRSDGIINDPLYGEIIDRINLDPAAFEPYPEESPLFFACRSLIFDRAAQDFITEHPHSTIVSFGSGLDFRFTRVDNGSIIWYDIDLPETIEIRKAIFRESARERFISSSALDTAWSSNITGKPPMLFIAEGLLMYFRPDEVKALCAFLCKTYPDSMLLMDAPTTFYCNNAREGTSYPFVCKMSALWQWSVNSEYELHELCPGVSVAGSWRPMEMFGSRMPRSMKDLFAAEELPDFVKDQIIGTMSVYLVRLGTPGIVKAPKGKQKSIPDISLDDLLA